MFGLQLKSVTAVLVAFAVGIVIGYAVAYCSLTL